jgi:glycosyltransferase involved in cell wall biosynthesis
MNQVTNNIPLLNILIRTSNRPVYFNRLVENIRQQTYTNYRLLVSADSDETEAYVREAGITPVRVERLERKYKQTFPWNLYLNLLMDEVEDGWIMFMDDDDQYSDKTAFQLISAYLENENKILVWRMQFPDGRNVPSKEFWGIRPFTRRQIGMPCFAFHSKWKKYVRFDGNRAGDYRMANQLQQFLEVEWLNFPLVKLDNFGNAGKRNDLK